MGLNKQSGNMYDFVTHTWNPIKGKCSHECTYCYMKRFSINPIRLDEKELKTDLGKDNFIFVGSGTDMFAMDVPMSWIGSVLCCCKNFDNTYLFQSKNPSRFSGFSFPDKTIFGTTIESNRNYTISATPNPSTRALALQYLRYTDNHKRTMVTIEPIMDFDLDELVELIKIAQPEWVNIGADSKKSNLPEPSYDKVLQLIEELSKFTEVKQKRNLDRLRYYKDSK